MRRSRRTATHLNEPNMQPSTSRTHGRPRSLMLPCDLRCPPARHEGRPQFPAPASTPSTAMKRPGDEARSPGSARNVTGLCWRRYTHRRRHKIKCHTPHASQVTRLVVTDGQAAALPVRTPVPLSLTVPLRTACASGASGQRTGPVAASGPLRDTSRRQSPGAGGDGHERRWGEHLRRPAAPSQPGWRRVRGPLGGR